MPSDKPVSPYENLNPRAFWRSGVTARHRFEPGDLYQPRFPIDKSMRIVTAGSCFAQHVGRTLRTAGFNVLDAEPLPRTVPDTVGQKYGYRMYSARYGNIYTARQLVQLLQEAYGEAAPADTVWEKDGRYYDAFRPNVEPGGLDTPEQVAEHREAHLRAVRSLFDNVDLFVFTFGLTEAWIHKDSGTVFPTAPGTLAGQFDPDTYVFKNYEFPEVLADFEIARDMIKARNPNVRFLITTSPVPLTATASGLHVEVATIYSKSVLRAVCGSLYTRYEFLDYFPSYEVITSQNARGGYYSENMRSVAPRGVETAMGLFMSAHGYAAPDRRKGAVEKRAAKAGRDAAERGSREDDVVCEEALLEAFLK